MDKIEYTSRLSNSLQNYEITNKYDILADYEQIIDEILLDYDDDFNYVIDKLGYPEILAMDIASELGYEIKTKKKEAEEDLGRNRLDIKRQRSNTIWNIILAFFYFFQFCFTIGLICCLTLIFYFGIDSRVEIATNLNNNEAKTQITICSKNQYHKQFRVESKDVLVEFKNHKYFYNNELNDETVSINTGLFLCLSSAVLFSIIILNYFIVYKNVSNVIKNNNEYNRRRNYD